MAPDPVMIHAADLHLGVPLDSLGRHLDPARARHYRTLARKAFDRLVDVAIEHRAAALLLAGDVYDQADREVAAQLTFVNGLRRLGEADIPVFIVHGNHDPLVAGFRPAAALPANVHVFAAGAPQACGVDTPVGEWSVAGVSFAMTAEKENLAARFHGIATDTGPQRTIGLLHANLEGTTGHDPYAPCSRADLEAAPVAYWALGHIHLRTAVPMGAPGRWYAYPGNLQGRSTKPAECGPKGALAVGLSGAGVREPRFLACDRVRFERLDVDVSDAHDADDALEIVAQRAAAAAGAAADVPLLLRVRLTGATAAHAALRTVDDRDLLALLRDRGSDIGDGAFLRIERATRAAVDRNQLLERKDLVAELLGRLDNLRAGPPDDVRAQTVDAIGHMPSAKLVDDLLARDPALAAELLDRTERLLLDQFAGDPT